MIEPILLTAARICTFAGDRLLTNASGFFFERDGGLHLVTSRHVVSDPPSGHSPDRIEIEMHTDADDMARSVQVSIPLFRSGARLWRQGHDSAGAIDVATVALDRAALPPTAVFHAFTPAHIPADFDRIEVGSPLRVVGFPLGFHDTLHHMPVMRQASIASSFGLRFQGQGYFLTDARTHRGISGAPVVMRVTDDNLSGNLPWRLLGVHSARLDMGSRDLQLDEALGLNCAWYADILMTLTASR